ncbi:MAG: cytochrome c biogenesis protein CcsA [Polyangiaceae bacterium]
MSPDATQLLSSASFVLGSLLYTSSVVSFFVQVVRGGNAEGFARLGPYLLAAAALSHGAFVTATSFLAHVCPVESVHFALSVASLIAIISYLLARLRWKIDVVGAFVAPIGLCFLLGTRIIGLDAAGPKLPPMFLTLHVASNLAGEALFLLSCVTAGLYLFAEKRLKQRRGASLVGRLPPLDALDQAEHRFLLLGFPLLTLGIVTGTAWAHKLESGTAAEILRAAFAYLTWLVFAGVLLLRAAAGWRGRRAALGTIAGFFLTVIVLLVYLVRPGPTPPASASPAQPSLNESAPFHPLRSARLVRVEHDLGGGSLVSNGSTRGA